MTITSPSGTRRPERRPASGMLFPVFAALFCLRLTGAFSQEATTYTIEKLSRPKDRLATIPSEAVFDSLGARVEKSSPLPQQLVFYGDHPFLTGILRAYQEHRPFVLSPDMIWLLISQGFSRHVLQNAEQLRDRIVHFKDKKELVVSTNQVFLGNPGSKWDSLFPQFTSRIAGYTGKELIHTLTADFTTTTPVTKIVSQITIMETMKAYFKYRVIILGCGIPEITLEGSVEDWEKVLQKTRYLTRYDLKWWTDELEPVLDQIIRTKKGQFDKNFWMNMVKVHTRKNYGTVTSIDGWIIKLFPYTKEGSRTGFKPIFKIDNLASELVKVPFILEEITTKKIYEMEFWGGFVGLSQNKKTFALRPEIGWAVHRKGAAAPETPSFGDKKEIDDLTITNVDALPDIIYGLEQISSLRVSFLGKIDIPDKLAKVEIGKLELNGKITPEEEDRIRGLFPKSWLIINGRMKP